MADSVDTTSLPEIHPSRRSALVGLAGALTVATGITAAVAVRGAKGEEAKDAKVFEVAGRLRAEWDLYDEMCVIVEDLSAKDADVYLAKVMDQLHVVDELTGTLANLEPQTFAGVAAMCTAAINYGELETTNDEYDDLIKNILRSASRLGGGS